MTRPQPHTQSENVTQVDRRRHPRIVVACPARIYDLSERLLVKGKTVDISAGGLKIMGPAVREVTAGHTVEVRVELVMPDTKALKKIRRQATIRRVEMLGDWTAVALQFDGPVDL